MSDHALAVIGLIVGVAGIAVGFLTSFYFYLKAREKVDPRYLLSFEPLVSQSSGAMKDVSVLYNDTKATNLNRCTLLIWNRGRKAIAHESVAERDNIRVRFPDGTKALGAGIRKSSRDAINLSALVDDDGSSVAINFDFLDEGDGGAIEILSQGDPKLPPSVAGSIMGAPKGIRRAGGPSFHFDYDEGSEDDDEAGTPFVWKAGAGLLVIGAVISTTQLGDKNPISVILYTLVAEALLGALLFAGLMIYFRQMIGIPKFVRDELDDDS